MSLKKKTSIVLISVLTIAATAVALWLFVALFFFFGFFNPVLYFGTSPSLLLMFCLEKPRRKSIAVIWLVTTTLLVVTVSAILFIIGFGPGHGPGGL